MGYLTGPGIIDSERTGTARLSTSRASTAGISSYGQLFPSLFLRPRNIKHNDVDCTDQAAAGVADKI